MTMVELEFGPDIGELDADTSDAPTEMAADVTAAEAINQWDLQKARSMASVVLSLPDITMKLGEMDRLQRQIAEFDGFSTVTTEVHDTESGPRPGRLDELLKQWRCAAPVKQAHELAAEITSDSNEKLAPYETLYDINPDRFAKMPVDEFTRAADRLTGHEQVVQAQRTAYEKACELYEQTQTSMENTKPLEGDDVVSRADDFLAIVAENAQNGLRGSLFSAFEKFYEKSPRQIAQAVLNTVGTAQWLLHEQKLGAEADLQDFLDSWRSQPAEVSSE